MTNRMERNEMHYISKGIFSPASQFFSAFTCLLKARQFTELATIYQAVGLDFCRQACFPNRATKSKIFFVSTSRRLGYLSGFTKSWALRIVDAAYQTTGIVFSSKVCNANEPVQIPYNKQRHQRAFSAGLATAARLVRRCFGRYKAI